MQATNTPAASAPLIAVPANDHVEVKPEQRSAPTEKGGRRKRDLAVPATIVATGDDAPMPRPTKKELKAAQDKAASASRVQEMTQDNMDATKQAAPAPVPAPAPEVPRETPPADPAPSSATTMLNEVRQGEAATQAPAIPTTGYQGPMRSLRERLKQGAYQKMPNGQPANGDEVATALGNLEPLEVVKALMIAFDHTTNIYGHLNVGQQSMNYRNKFRGALKRGELGMGVLREAVEVVLEARPAPAPGQTPVTPAPEAVPAPQADTPAPVQAQDGEPVANPEKVDDPSTASKRSEASKKAAATRKANAAAKGDPRKAQGRG